MKFKLRGASSAAILVGLAGAFPAWAQTGPQPPVDRVAAPQADEPPAKGDEDRVVVTGSYIVGTPEDAALPVEVYSAEDLEDQGAPTALEFAKSLSIAGPTTGEAYYFSGAALTGTVAYNLRGLGADKTLTLLNGRRMSQNTSNIPSAALARTEILKDGAAVIYGADAVGGVVNFITRDDFVGFEAKAQYKYVDGSDGDYGLSLLGGMGEGETNFLWSAEWEHRSRLETEDRDFSSQPYYVNPAPWSTLTNLASWLPRGALPATPSPFFTANGGLTYTQDANGEFGTATAGLVRDFTTASCNAVGGVVNPNGVAAGIPACAYNYSSYYNLVEENDIYRLFAQLNTTVNENMDIHLEAAYGQVMSPQVFGSPAQPVIRGPALTAAATYQFYAPARANADYAANPYAAAFLTANAASFTGGATGAAFLGTQGLTPLTYRAFAHGGNPAFGEGNGYGVPSKIDNQIWRVSASVNGSLPESLGIFAGINYDAAVTYNQSISYADAADVIGFRLQEALAGFGGPNCSTAGLDQNPLRHGTQNPAAAGKNGCLFWNPFSTSFPNQPELGLSNPNYAPGSENPLSLIRWIFDQRAAESINSSLTFDGVFSGETPIALPGGNIGAAVGFQGRQIELRENVTGNLYNGSTPCEWPSSDLPAEVPRAVGTPGPLTATSFNGCTPDNPGPFVFFGINPPDYNDQQQFSIFSEFSLPVLDNLNLQAAVRREEFSGGLGATVYKISGKWDVFGPLSLRASYGTNYAAPPAGLIPGNVNNGVNSYTRVGGAWLGAQTVTQAGVTPETATAWNAGIIWQSQGFAADHDFRLIIDYFNIETEKEIRSLASVNDIAAAIFRYNPGSGAAPTEAQAFATNQGTAKAGFTQLNTGTALADCSHPLISRVSFNSGTCVQGTTTARDFASIRTDFGNGPGQQTAGYDIQMDYSMPFGPGDLSLGVTATNTSKFKFTPLVLDGFQLTNGDDRLGTLNFATIANAASEWRANANLNYRLDNMNFRLVNNYISGVVDERGPIDLSTAGGIGVSTYGYDGKDWFTFDFHWTWDIVEDLRVGASVVNITDKDPPASRQELGYDPRIGSPLGRTVEVSVKKTF